jgi:polynucleotide 5'-hydroxyl-kinase GRC3/NOL9
MSEDRTDPSDVDSGLLDQVRGHAVMVIGATGTGKTRLAQRIAAGLAEKGETVGFVSADMGQPLVGVPTCLGLSMDAAKAEPSALWFIGDVSPCGHLLPTVVGTAKLAGRARSQKAGTILIDTAGLVEGGVARALKYHKALAAGVACVLAIQRSDELEDLVGLLSRICPNIVRLRPALDAEDRSLAERKACREQRYREYFAGGVVYRFDAEMVGPSKGWHVGAEGQEPELGTVVGLLDDRGYCLGLGTLEEAKENRFAVFCKLKNPPLVGRLQLGTLRLDRQAGFAEIR